MAQLKNDSKSRKALNVVIRALYVFSYFLSIKCYTSVRLYKVYFIDAGR